MIELLFGIYSDQGVHIEIIMISNIVGFLMLAIGLSVVTIFGYDKSKIITRSDHRIAWAIFLYGIVTLILGPLLLLPLVLVAVITCVFIIFLLVMGMYESAKIALGPKYKN